MAVLDTNVVIRYLTRDNPDHSHRAYSLLQALESGERTASLPEGVLVEVVQVLSSRRLYNLGREEIRTRVAPVLALRGSRIPGRRTYLRALDLYVKHARLAFVDALCVAHAQGTNDATVIASTTTTGTSPD